MLIAITESGHESQLIPQGDILVGLQHIIQQFNHLFISEQDLFFLRIGERRLLLPGHQQKRFLGLLGYLEGSAEMKKEAHPGNMSFFISADQLTGVLANLVPGTRRFFRIESGLTKHFFIVKQGIGSRRCGHGENISLPLHFLPAGRKDDRAVKLISGDEVIQGIKPHARSPFDYRSKMIHNIRRITTENGR